MIQTLFRAHGTFCASHPLEVVVTTVTVIMSLMSLGGSVQMEQDKVCGWNYLCAKEQKPQNIPIHSIQQELRVLDEPFKHKKLKGTDVILLSIARCIALVYIYMQFRNLRRLGSKHLLGISGVFTIFSSFIFCIAFVKLYGNTLSGLHEALPFFLFLIDLSKASALAVFALSSTRTEEVSENIGHAMSLLGPAITLDMIVESLAIGLGTLSGVPQLEIMCSFGCLSVVANYVAFMTFYPACLSLVLELSMEVNQRPLSIGQYKHLAEELRQEHEVKRLNPVTQRVKIIMSVGLAIVHIHNRLIAPRLADPDTGVSDTYDQYQQPEMTIWQFYLYRMFAVHIDYGMTLMLGVVLLVKYIFVDRHADILEFRRTIQLQKSFNMITMETQTDTAMLGQITEGDSENIKTSFSIGDDDSSGDESEAVSVLKESKSTQTNTIMKGFSPLRRLRSHTEPRSREECVRLLKSDNGVQELTDEEIMLLVESRDIPAYKLEGMLGDCEKGVAIRRQIVMEKLPSDDAMDNLPFSNYHYDIVKDACCENVIGYMPLPVGVAGPLLLDGKEYMVPMATTEGCLVASTNRGCSALRAALKKADGVHRSGGVQSDVIGDGMSRAPVVRFPSAMRASEVNKWLRDSDNFDKMKDSFDQSSRHARLERIQVAQAGKQLYIRFVSRTGDAMGMNMISKGTERALDTLQQEFTDMEKISLSGNFCTDKKHAAVNWIEGRGKSVVCEAVIPAEIVRKTLKTSVNNLVDLNISKNLVGSAMAGSIGGFNAHAANIVTAIFIATGQDPAQTMASANCITLLEACGDDGEDLHISCTMPSIEVGTVGGGTVLPPQAACLKMLGIQGASEGGENARQLARVVCATVLAGELSLMSALAAGQLVRSHLRHNRSSIAIGASDRPDGSARFSTNSLQNIPGAMGTNLRSKSVDYRQSDICERVNNQSNLCQQNSIRHIPQPHAGQSTSVPHMDLPASARRRVSIASCARTDGNIGKEKTGDCVL